MLVTVDNEIYRVSRFGQVLEDLIYNQTNEGPMHLPVVLVYLRRIIH
jgi:hypothetical protein